MSKFLAWKPRSSFARYATATCTMFVAFIMRVAMGDLLGQSSPRIWMTLAILLSAWWGGQWAGIYATFLGALLGNLLVAPVGSFLLDNPKHVVQFFLFIFIGTTVSILVGSMESAQDRAQAAAAAARRNWETLLESDQRAHSMAQRAVEWRSRFEALAETASRVVYVWEPRCGELRFSETLEALLGYSPGELGSNQQPWLDLIHPDDRAQVAARFKQSDPSQPPGTTEYRVRHRNGDYLDVEDRSFSISNSAGEVEQLIGVLTDLSRRKQFAHAHAPISASA